MKRRIEVQSSGGTGVHVAPFLYSTDFDEMSKHIPLRVRQFQWDTAHSTRWAMSREVLMPTGEGTLKAWTLEEERPTDDDLNVMLFFSEITLSWPWMRYHHSKLSGNFQTEIKQWLFSAVVLIIGIQWDQYHDREVHRNSWPQLVGNNDQQLKSLQGTKLGPLRVGNSCVVLSVWRPS